MDDAISKLDDGVKELLVLYYGLKGDRYTKSELAKKRLQSYSSIDYQINQNLNLVKRELVLELLKNINENERLKVMNNLFFSQIKLNDINELKEAFSTLKPIEIRLLKLYFGLDGKNVVSIENLCQILNITKKEKLISKVEIIMNKINSYIPKDNNIKIKNK